MTTERDEPLGSAATVVDSAPAAPSRASRHSIPPGSRIGRYEIERALGAGGMGVVYVARDPALGRNVAIKLLHEGSPSERLRGEAQALAKLDHRNVVAVYDVGEHDGQAFVAMALVDGVNLRTWLEQPRTPREVLRVIVDAGRGLAAAHAAGLIHRDLKPDNIFVSARGEVRVGDFGLARDARATSESDALVGTPAYMAPEQAAGEPTFASDQFALCATAWEAFYGQRPFTGATMEELLDAIARGDLVAPSDERGVPRRVRRALERGLAVDPAARWPSVDALLAELAYDASGKRFAIGLAGAGVVAAASVAWAVTHVTNASEARCPAGDDRIAALWTPARAADLQRAIVAVAPYAEPSATRATALLDGYATRWRTAWDETCRATLSPADFDLRAACLDGRLHAFASAVDVLAAPDRDSARHVLDVANDLPALDHCSDLVSLRKVAPPPPAIAARVTAVESALATGDALIRAGRYPDAEKLLRKTRDEADALAYAPTRGHAAHALGSLMNKQGHFTDAKPLEQDALNQAIAASDDELAARAYVRAAGTAIGLADSVQARELVATADAALQRIGDPPELRARLLVMQASLPALTGDYVETGKRVEAAIARLEGEHRMLEASGLYRMRSALLLAQGRLEDARAAFSHEIDVDREVYGAAHPEVGDALIARGGFLLQHGHAADAAADYDLGYRTLAAALGEGDMIVIKAGAEVASLDLMFGRYEPAIAKLERAAGAVTSQGPQQVAQSRRSLAEALTFAKRYDDADREIARALAIDSTLEGPYHISDDLQLAQIRYGQGKLDEASALADKVEPQIVKLFGAGTGALADVWILRARIELARGHADRAAALVAKITDGSVAEAKVVLAQALAKRGDRAGAAAAAKAANDLLDQVGPGARPDLRAQLPKL